MLSAFFFFFYYVDICPDGGKATVGKTAGALVRIQAPN